MLEQTEMSPSTDQPSSEAPEDYLGDFLGYTSSRVEDPTNSIQRLEETLQRYKGYVQYRAIFRDPLSPNAKENIDPKWVQGLDVPLSPENRRPCWTMAIVFDPSSTEFAAIHESLLNRESCGYGGIAR